DGDSKANEEFRTRLTQALDTELTKLVEALNKVPPLVEQAHKLLILENALPKDGVQPYRATTKEHLLFSVGKPDQRIPELPSLDENRRVPVELWIAVSGNA